MADLLDFPKLMQEARLGRNSTGLRQQKMAALEFAPPVLINGGLETYTGTWNYQTAAHLLRRAMFAPNAQQIQDAITDGLTGTIEKLLSTSPEPDLPINYDNNNDPNVPIGSSWVNAAVTPNLQYAHRSLRAWQVNLFLSEGVNLREKMVLFWHNHFVTADAPIAKMTYQYVQLLRNNAFGNFKTLVEEITVNPLMLRYLNGNENNKNAPNENYARELLELFTIGKGPLVAPGDYTNYTEHDIKEIARSLTGWVINYQGLEAAGPIPPANFRQNRHDTGSKTLSHRFDNAVIDNLGAEEYKRVIEIIMTRDEVARFLARELYKWFVYYNINDEVEATVIEPLADIIRQNNYEVKPALEALLSSQHFYDENAIGCQIKSPVDFLTSVFKPFGVELPFTLNQKYTIWFGLHGLNATMQQDVFTPPDVAGWKAYYQDPVFYRNWINSVTLTVRRALTDGMASGQIEIFDRQIGIDVLKVADGIPNAVDPNALIKHLADLLMPWPLTDAQLAYLKEVLIPGLPDFEWSVEYGLYLQDPDNEAIRMAVENRLRVMFIALLGLPEFQLQ